MPSEHRISQSILRCGIAAWLAVSASVAAAELGFGTTIRLAPVARGLELPIDIVAAPGDATRLFIVEQAGRIRIVRDGVVVATPFLDITAKTTGSGESGLLGLAFHPSYASNRRLFVYYTRNSDGALIIERYERAIDHPERAELSSARTLLAIPHPGATNHNGGKLAFGSDGYLYIGTGDGGGGNDPFNNAQTLGVRLGKMLRIDADVDTPPYYAIPPTNPFAANACNGAGVGTCPEIWALGLRNPWRFSFDRSNGDLFIGDVGQGAREEVDHEPSGTPGGRNYGWRILEGDICTPAFGPTCTPPPNYAPPIVAYDRTAGTTVTGGFRYRGARIPPLAAAYLYADFGTRHIWAATTGGGGTWTGQQLLLDAPGPVSTFGEDNAGELYLADYASGTIYRIDPADSDGDLLPDWWELQYFGSATAAAAAIDSDGDNATNLTEYFAGTIPNDPQSVPSASPFIAPRITSPNALVCVVGTPCSLYLAATGTPQPQVGHSGALPGGLGFSASTGHIAGTALAGSAGTYVQTISATNGVAPNAAQTLTLVVVASCGGFTDVAGADAHCNSVEWLRNRAIALGCTSSQYCPGDAVARASMALFQHRLGLAVTPALQFTEASGGSLALAPQAIVCASGEIAPATHPRNVQATFAVSVSTSGPLVAGVTLVASRNGGATWDIVTGTRMRVETAAAAWRSASGHGLTFVGAGEAVRLGLALERESGAANVDATRCQIASMIVDRDGSGPPRDE